MGFKELFKIHDDLMNFIDSQRSKIDKMDQSKYDKYQDAVRLLEERKTALAMFYRGFLYFSLPMAARDRSINIRRAFSHLGCTLMVTSGSLLKSSLRYLKDMEINKANGVAATSTVLEQLSLKTLDASDVSATAWGELPPNMPVCFGLLRAAQGFIVAPPVNSSVSVSVTDVKYKDDDKDLSKLLRQAEIIAAAGRPDGFDEEEDTAHSSSAAARGSLPHYSPPPPPPPAPGFSAIDEPESKPRAVNSQKVSSLLGDLTGDRGSAPVEDKSDLWN